MVHPYNYQLTVYKAGFGEVYYYKELAGKLQAFKKTACLHGYSMYGVDIAKHSPLGRPENDFLNSRNTKFCNINL